MILTSQWTGIHAGAVFLVSATVEWTAIALSPTDTRDTLLITLFLQSFESFTFGSVHLSGSAGVSAHVNPTGVEKIFGIDAANTNASAEGAAHVFQTTAMAGSTNQATHAAFAPILGLWRSDHLSSAAMASRRIIIDSVRITDEIIATAPAHTFTVLGPHIIASVAVAITAKTGHTVAEAAADLEVNVGSAVESNTNTACRMHELDIATAVEDANFALSVGDGLDTTLEIESTTLTK